MAYTASFKIGDYIVTDNNCFASLRHNFRDPCFIIIEKCKFYFKKEFIIEYLNDIIEMGFDISFSYDEDNEQFLVDVSNLRDTFKRITCCILVRFIWEGFYKPDYGDTDKFYKVVEHYRVLKNKLPQENKLKLICIACNCFIFSGNNYNTNHFLSNRFGCLLKDKLDPSYLRSINEYFNYKNERTYDLAKVVVKKKDPKKWKDNHYKKIFKYIKYE